MRKIGIMGWKNYSGEGPDFEIQNLYDLFDVIRKRPGLFIGTKSLTGLWHFHHGYLSALMAHGIKLEDEEPEFQPFCYFVEEYFSRPLSTSGWHTVLLEECENDQRRAFDMFFELLDIYRGEPS